MTCIGLVGKEGKTTLPVLVKRGVDDGGRSARPHSEEDDARALADRTAHQLTH